MKKVYVIGSLRNLVIPDVANTLESAGHSVYASWQSPGPDADEHWKTFAQARGKTYLQELHGPHVQMVFDNDIGWLNWCDVGLLVLPAGKSAFCELGYLRGRSTYTIALLGEANPERWDIMLRFADRIVDNMPEVLDALGP